MNQTPPWRQVYRTGELPQELIEAIRDAEAPEQAKTYDPEYDDSDRSVDE